MIRIVRNNSVYIKYGLIFLMLIAMAFARTREGIAPFHVGIMAALMYCGQNMIVIAPMYFAASMLAEPTVRNLIFSIAPPLIFMAVYFVHKFSKRRAKLLYVLIYTALAMIPQLCLAIGNKEELIYAVASVVMAAIFAYLSSISLYALVVKRTRYNFATDEMVGLFAIAAAIGMGVFSFDIYGFKPFYIITSLGILFVQCGSIPAGFMLALSVGLGAGAFDANIMVMSGLLVSTAFSMIFIRSNIYLSAISFMLGDLLSGMFFNAYGAYNYLHIIAVALGVGIFILTPKKQREQLIKLFNGGENFAVRAVVKRSREDNAMRLESISKVFGEIAEHLYGARYVDVEAKGGVESQLCESVAMEVCAKCPNYSSCAQAMGGNVATAFMQLVTLSLTREVDIRDVTPFLSSRCNRINTLLSCINANAVNYKEYVDTGSHVSISRIIVSEQMRGLQEILSGLARGIGANISFDSEREKRVVDELRYNGITARQVLCESLNGWRLLLLVRNADLDKPELKSALESVIKCPLDKVKTLRSEIDGYSLVEFVDKPKFSISVGVATMPKDGSEESGDTYSCGALEGGKYILALTDGMGSGSLAHYNSCSTISMIENYYKAGFDNNIILSLINRILAEFNKESFTCLDMAVIDLRNGMADFIKLGGVDGIILHGREVEVVESGALPMGIVEEAEPSTVRKVLSDGDVVILMSDGISDSLGFDGVARLASENKTDNMQVLSRHILDHATRNGASDDSTVICARIFNDVIKI